MLNVIMQSVSGSWIGSYHCHCVSSRCLHNHLFVFRFFPELIDWPTVSFFDENVQIFFFSKSFQNKITFDINCHQVSVNTFLPMLQMSLGNSFRVNFVKTFFLLRHRRFRKISSCLCRYLSFLTKPNILGLVQRSAKAYLLSLRQTR
jgi:hypothetical protein